MGSRRTAVRQLLRRHGAAMSVHQVARELEWPVETARRHLEALARQGLLRREVGVTGSRGRPPMTYRVIGGRDSRGPTEYRLLAEILAASLQQRPDGAQEAVAISRRWGLDQLPHTRAAPTASDSPVAAVAVALNGFLAEHSFEPILDLRGDQAEISLWQCPFIELFDQYGEIICALHDGMLSGLIAASDTPTARHELRPFEQPDRCVVTLSPGTTIESAPDPTSGKSHEVNRPPQGAS
ncbi:MAG: transcriptional regulator [Actinomycetales bacterium]|nr:MAG: transcriptional regulator [Actinomycetales bacterium]